MLCVLLPASIVFFFNDTATTEIYTLSLHDALPISANFYSFDAHTMSEDATTISRINQNVLLWMGCLTPLKGMEENTDRKSTRLNSSHLVISYAVFCLKKTIVTQLTPIADRL